LRRGRGVAHGVAHRRRRREVAVRDPERQHGLLEARPLARLARAALRRGRHLEQRRQRRVAGGEATHRVARATAARHEREGHAAVHGPAEQAGHRLWVALA